MQIAIGQMRIAAAPEQNLRQITVLAGQAAGRGARLLLLPEGLTSRDPADPDAPADHPQALDGPLMEGLRELGERHGLALAGSIHTPTASPRVANTGFLLDHGELLADYRKLHLYDAFRAVESTRVEPGALDPPIAEIDGLAFGLMVCYDLRFPEVARSLALRGAQVILVPAAWARGPLKEMHWRVLAQSRALENTAYLVACSETSAANIGCSLVVDPLGVVTAAAGAGPQLLLADVEPGRIAEARQVLPVLANRRYQAPQLRAPGGQG